MELTKQQNIELDSLKSSIERTEKLIEESKSKVDYYSDLEDDKKVAELEKGIHYGYAKINKMVSMQAEAMTLPYDLVIDLIFDREYTLNELRNIN